MGNNSAINPVGMNIAPETRIGRGVFMLAYNAMKDDCI